MDKPETHADTCFTTISLRSSRYRKSAINIYLKKKVESEVTQSCPTLCDPMDYVAHQAHPSMGFYRPRSPAGRRFNLWATREAYMSPWKQMKLHSPPIPAPPPTQRIYLEAKGKTIGLLEDKTDKYSWTQGRKNFFKHLPAMREIQVWSLGQEDPLEKEMATHSCTVAWKIPRTEVLVGYSQWDHKELIRTEQLHFKTLRARTISPCLCILILYTDKTALWTQMER